jgi:23S rRNA (guanosine2251-2'-O)-methyltransferase
MANRKRTGRPASEPRPGPGATGGSLRQAEPWIWGSHPVRAALGNPARRIRRLLGTAEGLRGLGGNLPPGLRPELLERPRLDQILPKGAVHQGLALLAEPLPEPDLLPVAACVPGRPAAMILLDQVTDPHNVGAILRSAAAFGAQAVVVTERHAPEVTGVLAKAASGALELVPLVRVVNLARALDQLGALGWWRIGLDGGAARTLAAVVPAERPIALVLGAEGSGLRRLTRERCDELARLPIRAEMESLNVSNAAAAALYELARGTLL